MKDRITPTYLTIGQPIPRVDAIEKVTGQATYGDDLSFSNMLHGKALRSPYAHAKIVNIDVTKAQRLPGVKAIVTGKDIPVLGGEALKDYPFVATDRVRYIGEPLVAVAAIDEETAEEALDLITVQYEQLPALFDPLKAMEPNTPLIHERLHTYEHIPVIKPVEHTNICHHVQFIRGDVDQGFDESDLVFEDTFTTQMAQHGALELHMAVAQVDPGGRITVWVTNDAPHRLRNDLATALRIPLTKIRVVSPPYMGGGFGGKGGLKVETLCIALALKTDNRPVKMVLTREEVFTSSLVRHPSIVQLKTGVKKDGRLWARQAKVIYDTGAYAEKGPTVCQQGCVAAAGPYNITHVKVDGYCVYTNKPIAGAYRGYGFPQVAWAHESQMDIIAHKLGIDPVTLRLQNVVEEEDTSPTGKQVLHSVGLKECIKRAAQSIEWDMKSGKKHRGKGIACAFKNTKTPSGSSAIVKVSQDGSVEVLTSTVEIGQGAKTIISQMVAEELDVPLESITVATPDTDLTPYDASTTSSRTTFHMGNAVKKAAKDAREQLFGMASEMLGVETEDLRGEKGKIYSQDNPKLRLSLAEVIKNQYGAGLDIIGRGSYYPLVEGETGGMWSAPSIFWMYGADCVEVEVDLETGQVKILRAIGAHDVGKVINPVTCEGQIEGGIVHGMGPTLFEEMVVGERGDVLNPSFADYKMPTALDIPEVTSLIVEATHREGPWGAKGIGEMTIVPIAPAIANGIYDAVGVRIKDLPITPDKILSALKRKQLDK
ncbi:MAG: xanthine dehydrogenase family protein molybdopterin-binding subunit [Deltaproteobacteria bacterium]|nr:MAG: xanthine dehydrogenase family protein molybdopterin-binding subunit [Deltaproteobacteria bacterium]